MGFEELQSRVTGPLPSSPKTHYLSAGLGKPLNTPRLKYIESKPEVLPNAPTNGDIPRMIWMTTGGVVQTPQARG